MTYKENIRAILECHFTGFKEEIIDSACNRILEQEPILDKIRAEIQENINYNKKMNYQGILAGLLLALDIIDNYKAKNEDKE